MPAPPSEPTEVETEEDTGEEPELSTEVELAEEDREEYEAEIQEKREERADRKREGSVDIIDITENKVIFPEDKEYKALTLPRFKFSIDIFRNLVRGVEIFVEEPEFVANGEGITFRAMDPSHVALVDLQIPRDACEKYECDGERKFAFRVERLNKILKRSKKNDSVEFYVKGNEAEITLEDILGNDKRDFTTPLIESQYGTVPLPKLSFDATFVMDRKKFIEGLKDMEATGNHVNIEVTREGVVFSTRGEEGKGSKEFKRSELKVLDVREPSKSTFSIEYLKKVLAAMVGADDVKGELATKTPIRLDMPIGHPDTTYHFYLAPRVEG